MTEFKLISIKPSSKSGKKLMATFKNKKTGRDSTTHFGQKTADDYTIKKDKEQRSRYRKRHSGDNLSNPRSAGALSYYILWGNSTSKRENIASYKRRFGL